MGRGRGGYDGNPSAQSPFAQNPYAQARSLPPANRNTSFSPCTPPRLTRIRRAVRGCVRQNTMYIDSLRLWYQRLLQHS